MLSVAHPGRVPCEEEQITSERHSLHQVRNYWQWRARATVLARILLSEEATHYMLIQIILNIIVIHWWNISCRIWSKKCVTDNLRPFTMTPKISENDNKNSFRANNQVMTQILRKSKVRYSASVSQTYWAIVSKSKSGWQHGRLSLASTIIKQWNILINRLFSVLKTICPLPLLGALWGCYTDPEQSIDKHTDSSWDENNRTSET